MEALEMDIADTIMDRPKGFTIGGRHFFLYPVTLGKAYLVKRVIDKLEIDKDTLERQPFGEALRLVEKKKEECSLLIAYHSLKGKEDVLNSKKVEERKKFFFRELDSEGMATLLIYCLTADKTQKIMKHLKIDKEMERMQRVMKVKDSKNTYQFGGVSVYGSIIDSACERYGWAFDYVVWGISYTNLQLLLRDSVKTIYLTDKEAKKCHVPQRGRTVDGNNEKELMAVIKGSTWK